MLRQVKLLFLLAVTQVPVFGQRPSTPALKDLQVSLQKSRPDTNRIRLLFELGNYFASKSKDQDHAKAHFLDTALHYFNAAIHLSDSLNQPQYTREAMLLKAEAFLSSTRKAEAERIFLQVAMAYHIKKDFNNEALTWLRLATRIPRARSNLADIISYLQRSSLLFNETGNVSKEAETKLALADLYYVAFEFNKADKEARESLELYKSIGHKRLYHNYYLLSVINRYRGNFDKSLVYATSCLQNAQALGEVQGGGIYAELALVYSEIGKPEESVYWYRETLEKRKAHKVTPFVLYRTAGLMVEQLVKLKRTNDAIALISELEREYPPASNLEKASLEQCKANCYDASNQYARAEAFYADMQKHYELSELKDEYITKGYADMGKFYLKYKQFEKAGHYLTLALHAEDVIAPSGIMEVLLALFKADSATGNYLKAVRDLQQYESLKDSIFNERKAQQIEELQIQYATEKKEKEIAVLNSQNKHQKSQLKNTVLARNLIIAGVIVLSIFFYYRYHLKQKVNLQLRSQQAVINQKNASLENLVKEKEWLVKEIHHRVKNNFQIVQGLLGTQSGYLKSKEALDALTDSRHRVQAMSIIHQKLYQSDNLSAINTAAYIHELVSYLAASYAIGSSIRFQLDVDAIELDLTHSIPLGLILNEALTNAIKYAFPGKEQNNITIQFKRHAGNTLILVIKDNGKGMPQNFDFQKGTSMGMKLMRGLSQDIDADFTINSSEGTEIRLTFTYQPVEQVGLSGTPS